MKKHHANILAFTADQVPRLNNELRDLWDWVSRAQYEKVTDATTVPTGGSHGELKILNDGTNRRLWANISSTWYNVGDMISTVPDHTHSGSSGDGGQVDWDNVWSDAVHSHESNAEGGLLGLDAIEDVRRYALMVS